MELYFFEVGDSEGLEGLGNILKNAGDWLVKTFDPNEQRERDEAKATQNNAWVAMATKIQNLANAHKEEVYKTELACITEVYELEKRLAQMKKQPPPEYPEALKIQARQRMVREAVLNTDALELSISLPT